MRLILAVLWVIRQTTAQPANSIEAVEAEVEICYNKRINNETVSPFCGKRWAVINAANVREFWEVHELEFYWDSQCTLPFPVGLPIASDVMTSFPGNTEDMAWDGDLLTRWSANCRVLLGGCSPYTQWVGKNIGDSIPLNKEPVEIFAQVRCTRIYQSPNATRQASQIAIITWENEALDSWQVIYDYGDLAGGAWHTRPAREESLWRIWNMDPMPRPWQVAEVMFFTDLFCEEDKQAFGTPISNGATFLDNCIDTRSCDRYTASKAFDGIKMPGYRLPRVEGTWIANCDEWAGCASMEAWIGLDFDVLPKQVRCIRINQPVHEGYFEGWGYPHFTSRILLQSWDGFKWEDRTLFGGLDQGGWNNTMPKEHTSWRIANFDRILLSWRVYELELYSDAECLGSPMSGESVDSNPALLSDEQQVACWTDLGSCGDNAFDRQAVTGWESACSPCDQRRAWIGLRFSDARSVACFRLIQSEDVRHRTDAIELAEWMGDTWETRRFESGVGGGTWNRRPSGVSTMWRLLTIVDTPRPWTITGLAFYMDDVCNVPHTGDPITNGNEIQFRSEDAFDSSDITQWVTSCTPAFTGHQGCMANSAWLGLQKQEAFSVSCIRLYQSRDRSHQASSAVLQVWDGLVWTASQNHPILTELGGGAWQVLPGIRGSMWRFLADPAVGGHGVGVSEIHLYRNTDCTDRIPMAVPNIVPICSGYATAREVGDKTGYTNHYSSMGELTPADPLKAFDGLLHTFWADIGGARAWLGLDFSTQVSDVQCIRLAFPGIRALQPSYGELQGWSGSTWNSAVAGSTSIFSMDSTLLLPLPSLGGQGFQRRPAPVNSLWRLQNVASVMTWVVFELELYTDLACRGDPIVGTPISSAEDAVLSDRFSGHMNPHKAFDKDNTSYWQAHCVNDVCTEGQAWVGLDLEGTHKSVQCIRLMQSGLRHEQVSMVVLASWSGEGFQQRAKYNGLGGDTWNTRPAPPDTMWRIAYGQRSGETCLGAEERGWPRSWGVTEVDFFVDDDCRVKLPGPKEGVDVVASGTREAGIAPLSGTGPHLAFDGLASTTWTAQCGAGDRANEPADCRAGVEWVGLDFNRKFDGLPVMIRCLKLTQSRSSASDCCDPAETVMLDRWNGTDWARASWRHVSDTGEIFEPEARFSSVAECPTLNPDQVQLALNGQLPNSIANRPSIQQRKRRQGDECIIPNPASVKLLADPFCEKHAACKEAGFVGTCCPMDSGMSRCCCDFNLNSEVFEDEILDEKIAAEVLQAPAVGFELIMIQSATVLPFIGVIFALLFLIIYAIPKPPSRDDGMSTCGERLWYRICGPTHRWLQGGGLLPTILLHLVQRSQFDKWWTLVLKRILLLLFGFIIGGMLLWVMLSYLLAEMITRIILACSFFMRLSKSRYDPKKPAERKRLGIVLGVPIGDPEGGLGLELKPPNLAGILFALFESIILGLVNVVQAMFDVLLIRFAFVSIGAVDLRLEAFDIIILVPSPPNVDVQGLVQFLVDLASVATRFFTAVISTMFVGAPRCEGPVVILSACFLIVITLLMVRWLNYDYFGLLTAAKYSAQKTRPTFQKSMAVGLTTGLQSGIFIGMQCLMLICTRSLNLVEIDPFKESTGWTCPYPDDHISVITGRIFLGVMALITLIIAFLCANGHFMGQEYILRDFSKQIDMKLTKLDPDAQASGGGGILRTSHFFSMLPTTFGIWIDSWNVKGYLLKERAELYAEELRVPQFCEHCGKPHIPYLELMKASGRQLSLAYQIFPFGAVIGKAVERFNNPPLIYWGTELKCLRAKPHVDKVKSMQGRKMTAGQATKYRVQLQMAMLKDLGLPVLMRVFSVTMYVTMVYFTAVMTQENVVELGVEMFQILTYVAFSKAMCEVFLPIVCVAIVAALVAASGVAAKKAAKAAVQPYRLSPVVGQVLHGVSAGFAFALFLYQEPGVDFTLGLCAFLGWLVGASLAVLIALSSYALELCANCELSGGIIKVCFAAMSAVGLARVFTWRLAETNFYLAMSMLALVLVPGTNLAFRKTPPEADGAESESSIWPLVSTARVMSGPFGVIAGVFGAMVAYEPMATQFGADIGLLVSVGFGYLLGLAYGLATDKMLEKPAGKWSVAAGTTAALGTSLLIHWAIGVIVGSVVGSVTGALIERRVMKEMDAQCLEPPRFTKNVMQSSPTLGPVSNVVAAVRDKSEREAEIHTNLPTLYKASAPGNQLARADSGYGAYDDFEKERTQLPFQSHPALTASPELALQDGSGSTGSPSASRQLDLAVVGGVQDEMDPRRPEDFNDEAMERRTSEPRLDDADNAAVFGTSQASWHSYGEVSGAPQTSPQRTARPFQNKAAKRTSLAASAKNAKVKNQIPPPGPRAVWGGDAGPGGPGPAGGERGLVQAAAQAADATGHVAGSQG